MAGVASKSFDNPDDRRTPFGSYEFDSQAAATYGQA